MCWHKMRGVLFLGGALGREPLRFVESRLLREIGASPRWALEEVFGEVIADCKNGGVD